MAVDLAGICLPALKRFEVNSDPDSKTTAMLKDVVSGLLDGEYKSESFTPAMRIFLATATGKAFWKWFAEHGALGSLIFLIEKIEETAGSYAIKQSWEEIRTGFRPL